MRSLLEDATLDNVREKYERSLRAWEGRAEVVERTIAARAGRN
jgi:phage baseplate assembly protein W